MAYPIIVFNADTGSDTAASGAGPATAVTGTGAAHTGGAATNVITLTNTPNLTDVLTDGSHCLWLNTSSGRQFSKITGKDDGADTVTVEDNFTIDAGSPVDYAIGGKRATFDDADSRRIFLDAKSFWSISSETDQTLTSSLSATIFTADAQVVLGNGNNLIFTFNSYGIDGTGSHWTFKDWTFKNTNATKTASTIINNGYIQFVNCVLGDSTDSFYRGMETPTLAVLVNCEIKNMVNIGIYAVNAYIYIYNCYIHDCGQEGLHLNSPAEFQCHDSIIVDNTTHGIYFSFNPINIAICNCTVDGNGGSGIFFDCNTQRFVVFKNNCLSNNTAYGMRANTTVPVANIIFNDRNNYYNNTSGDHLNWPAGDNDTALDPQFVNAAAGNYAIGSNLTGIGYPAGVFGNSSTESFPSIGAAQIASSTSVSSPKTLYLSSGLSGCN